MLIGNTRIGGIGSLSVKNTYDPDALSYLTAVEAADGQALENSVKIAINTFVVGCKTDGNWSALTNACIMAGARSVAGAIVPLRGNAPTNNGFVSGDYSRKTGLLGNASSKYILTGYNNVDLPNDNTHISSYITQAPSISSAARMFIGTATGLGPRLWMLSNNVGALNIKNRSTPTPGITLSGTEGTTIGFKGHSRSSSTNTIIRTSQSNTTDATSSFSATSFGIGVFGSGSATLYSDARMSFYSLGTNINLALLDTRITTLMTTLNALL